MIQVDFIKQLMLKKRIYYGNVKRERERECDVYVWYWDIYYQFG